MFSNGREWQEQMRFSMRHLRDFGFGKINMEGLILEEVAKCVDLLKEDCGKKTVLRNKMNIAILNALWQIVTSEKLEYEDPKLKEVVHKFDVMLTQQNIGGPLQLFPWLKHIVPGLVGYTEIGEAQHAVYDLIEKSYQEHLSTFDEKEPRDLLDVYINNMR